MKIILSHLVLVSSLWAFTFEEAWQKALDNNLVNSKKDQVSLKELEKEQAARHWLPEVEASMNHFQTDAPGGVFFNRLGQRAINATDFDPSELNHPESEVFTQSSLRATFGLYQGGGPTAYHHMKGLELDAEKESLQSTQSELYAKLLSIFATVKSTQALGQEVNFLKNRVNKMIKSYQLAKTRSPLAKSGQLGLLGLRKKITLMDNQLTLSRLQSERELSLVTGVPRRTLSTDFSWVNFLEEKTQPQFDKSFSSKISTQQKKIEALEYLPELEQANQLPTVGLFAQSDQFAGDRDQASATSIGIALEWKIFSPKHYGKKTQAMIKLKSAQKNLEYHQEQEKNYKLQNTDLIGTLKAQKSLLEQSTKNLKEQSRIIAELFQKGQVNVLQVVEVYNRRLDLISEQAQLHQQLVQAYTQRYQLYH